MAERSWTSTGSPPSIGMRRRGRKAHLRRLKIPGARSALIDDPSEAVFVGSGPFTPGHRSVVMPWMMRQISPLFNVVRYPRGLLGKWGMSARGNERQSMIHSSVGLLSDLTLAGTIFVPTASSCLTSQRPMDWRNSSRASGETAACSLSSWQRTARSRPSPHVPAGPSGSSYIVKTSSRYETSDGGPIRAQSWTVRTATPISAAKLACVRPSRRRRALKLVPSIEGARAEDMIRPRGIVGERARSRHTG
ncbi:hypothetical protein GMJLKIPL_0623 [Methylobacterium isbiliense]|uniref:Uncharacterized protein n=1 Tax=Methylobacterium isbiliense TaxID=315478 RepID=A0ABQ4SA94_9HYPH|nr:hypothetical protein GMJLKIPL_0623 [Methylobacterium isbiliense]